MWLQNTFIGLLVGLPNYDPRQSLESYLFAIAAHKAVDYRRRQGRRPQAESAPIEGNADGGPAARAPRASAAAASGERRQLEERALAKALGNNPGDWRTARSMAAGPACAELFSSTAPVIARRPRSWG